jgi:hypothetical protein
MPTATETAPEAEQVTVIFRSRDPEQVLTVRAAPNIDNGRGGKKVQSFKEYIEEQERNNIQRELTGADPLPIDDMPWKIEFKHNTFETSDPRVIEWLRAHPTIGTNGPSGFYEEPPPAESPETAMADPIMRIVKAQAIENLEDSVAALDEILQEEIAGPNRPAIVKAAEAAIDAKVEEPSEPEGTAETGNGDHGGPDGSDGAA